MRRHTLPIVLHNPKILLIGGGDVALQKARVMARNSIAFDLITLACNSEIARLAERVQLREIEAKDCRHYRIIIDATGNEAVHRMLIAQRNQEGFLLNVVDLPDLCDFFFAALIERGPIKIAVSSSGASPAIAQTIRDKIVRMLPSALGELADKTLKERLRGIIRPEKAKAQAKHLLGRVSLVGCGIGDVDLLTLRAYKAIREADVVFVDHLVSDEIKAIIPKSVEVIHVGKQKGHHSIKQEKINTLLITYAQKGLEVVRLKAGDPYIFGRGAEEAQALVKAGIRVEVIPGISSAISAPLTAGIPPTARGYAANLSIVSAHLRGNRINLSWIDLLGRENHTLIVLMGLSRAKEIRKAALDAGVRPDLPCAVISNASRSNQETHITTLEKLPEAAAKAARPAILVFGEVVRLHEILPHYNEPSDAISKGEESHDLALASGF